MVDPDPITRLNAALEGRYRIERELGEGGMATVYLAKDLRHNRAVALKVLRPELAAVVGAERFLAEIETTANLQHPHILPLFDSGEVDGFLFYVMPYVKGESLRNRLDRDRQLPVDEAVEIATKAASALDYAHREGIIHRDIKPANILLQDGEPLISDFGIALAVGAAGGKRLTATGLGIGTPLYMSPEQATGESALGPATDVFSLGCVLYEMLVGEPPFSATTPQAILGRILSGDSQPVRARRSSVPAHVDAVVLRALEPIPADRFVSAATLVAALADPTFRHRATSAEDLERATGRWKRVAGAGWGLAIVFAALTIWLWLVPGDSRPVVRYLQDFPPGEELATGNGATMAVSPDGNLLVYAGPGPQLWLRARDQASGRPIDGTEGGLQPAFSPDGRELAFVTDRSQLRAVSLDGGLPRTLVESNVRRFGAAWARDGYVYFTLEPGFGLHRVLADGSGGPEQLTRLDTSRQEVGHGLPEALPGGRGVLFTILRAGADAEIAILDAQRAENSIVTSGRRPRYAEGHLLFSRADGSLYAAPFDEGGLSLAGPGVPIVSGLTPGAADFAIARDDGRLIYHPGVTSQMVWVDRDGTEALVDSTWFGAGNLDVSPDGTRLAFGSEGDIWIKDLPNGRTRQLTFDGRSGRPAWTPSGESVTFVSGPTGIADLYQRKADGSEAPRLLLDEDRRILQAITSPDGSSWVFRFGVGDERDLFWASGHDRVPRPLRATSAAERAPSFSPDGRWVAYVSDETGQDEIYVLGFPEDEDGPTRVSTNGGTEPLWSHSGEELFYVRGTNRMTAVEVTAGETFFAGAQMELFSTARYADDPNHRSYDVSPDDQRFMMVRRQAEGSADRLTVVENFFAELRRLVND